MKTIIFKPKYAVPLVISLVLAILFEIYLLYGIFYRHNYSGSLIFLAILVGIGPALAPFIFIKSITLQEQLFTVEKYFVPTRTIAYEDIVEIDEQFIKIRQGYGIPLNAVTNSTELERLLKKRMQNWKTHIRFIVTNKMAKKDTIEFNE